MRHGVVMLGVAALLAMPAEAETLRQKSQRAVHLGGAKTVSVQNSRGQIEVVPSSDDSLHVTALKIVRASSSSVAQKLASQTQVELLRDGPRYRIRVKYPKGTSVKVNIWEGFNEFTVPRSEMRLLVAIPKGAAVELEAASAELATERLANAQFLETVSGDIHVESATGPVTISTSSGDVRVIGAAAVAVHSVSGDVQVADARGAVRVETSSGDVSADGLGDSLQVDTVTGDVSVDRAPAGARVMTSSGQIELGRVIGRLVAHSVSADIRATLQGPLRHAEVESSSGDVTLALTPNVACAIEMHTSSGDISVDIPSETKTVSRRLVTAVVRQGTAPVRLQTVSGNITVTRGEP